MERKPFGRRGVRLAGFCLPALLLSAVPAQGAPDIPSWLSVMPLRKGCADELARDAADLGNTTFIDGIAWSCPVHPAGDPVGDKGAIFAERFRETSAALRRLSSVRQGILLQSTMGHGGYPGSVTPWQTVVRPDGSTIYRMCPLDKRFLAYIDRTCRTLAALNADFFMVDDDTRIEWGDATGCFCPLHLAEFARRTGRDRTREEVYALLKKGPGAEAEIWNEIKADSLKKLFRTIRSAFGGRTPGMLCVVGVPKHLQQTRAYAEILAAPGQKPTVRGAGAPYHHGGKNLFNAVNMRAHYAWQRACIGSDAVLMQESDTCPHTLWSTSAVRTFDHLFLLALDGCKGAKIWITRTGNYHEKKSAAVYRRIFREGKGAMEWAASADFRPRGAVIPPCGPMARNFGDRYLALTGIPYRFGTAEKGEVTALTGDTLLCLPSAAIARILSGAVILDGSAALWLSKNGYSDDIGVRAKPWARKTIQLHEFSDGLRQSGMRTAGLADLTDASAGARILTKLHNIPRTGDDPVYEAPGSVLFTNRRGGKILTLAQPLPSQQPQWHESTLLSESYKTEMTRWLTLLGGGLPGGAVYLGAGPVLCMAGETSADGNVVVLDALDLDGDDAPELAFDAVPEKIERLRGDGTWENVRFERTAPGVCRLDSPILVQRPAVFRYRAETNGKKNTRDAR